ncbi:MAG: D-Ala-D-Ala carboxypeptidase family metallohydrolase [candidate division WOR-3 bacterium]
MIPYDSLKKGKIRGYPIGDYPDPKKGASTMIEGNALQYSHPPGFIMVPESLRDLAISPRFRLGDFVCPQPDTWPRYMYLEREQVVFLEELADTLGVPGFLVVSGYRSPWYNRKRGRGKWSRHQYGDATDIIVDLDGDWFMDDLNRDGKVDVLDAFVITDAVERMKKRWGNIFGMGIYNWGKNRTPFVHIDTRGFDSWWNPENWSARLMPDDEDRLMIVDTGSPAFAGLAMRTIGFLTSLPPETLGTDTIPDPKPPPVSKGQRVLVSPSGNAVFVYPGPDATGWKLAMYDETGAKLWEYGSLLWASSSSDRKPPSALAFSPDGLYLALFHGRSLYVFSRDEGLIWQKVIMRPIGTDSASLAFSEKGDLLYMSVGGRAYCFDVRNYSLVWVRSGDYKEIRLTDRGDLACLNRAGTLDLLDPISGRKRGEFNWYGLGYRGHHCTEIEPLSEGRVALQFTPIDPANALGPFYLLLEPAAK